jgi:hypothetical protein
MDFLGALPRKPINEAPCRILEIACVGEQARRACGGTLSRADTVINKNIICGELAMMGVVQVGVLMQGRGKPRRQRGAGGWDRYRCVVFPGKWKRLRVTGRWSWYRGIVFPGAFETGGIHKSVVESSG